MKKMKFAGMVLLLCLTLSGCTVWYLDADGDGFGDPEISIEAIAQPDGYVLDNTDCNDHAPTVYPGAPELMDNIDNQCPGDAGYGEIDEPGGKEPKVVDFSAFDIFRYVESESPVGFSPSLDAIHTATISNTQDGYNVEISIIRLRPDAPESCPDSEQPRMNESELNSNEDPCFELVHLPSRILTESEAQEMEDIFGAVTLEYLDYVGENPDLDGICIDPWLTITISWDSYVVYQQSSACYHQGEYHEIIGNASLRQIMSFLNSLR